MPTALGKRARASALGNLASGVGAAPHSLEGEGVAAMRPRGSAALALPLGHLVSTARRGGYGFLVMGFKL